MPVYRLSCPRMTVLVETTRGGTIKAAAPVVAKFIGQKLDNLVRWLGRFGEVDVRELE